MAVTKNSHSLAIIIPMFNEAQGADRCITEVQKVIKNIPKTVLIIVNDGSSDTTQTILKQKQKRYKKKMIVIQHQQNEGYGAALQTGIRAAKQQKSEYLLFMDSDLTNHPKYIKKFVALIPQNFDCVKASRFIPAGKMEGIPSFRKALSKAANIFARLCFRLPIHDCTNGFRMVKRNFLEKIPYTKNDFSIIVEELYYLKKYDARFAELPTVLTSRKTSSSRFSYSPHLLLGYLKYTILAATL